MKHRNSECRSARFELLARSYSASIAWGSRVLFVSSSRTRVTDEAEVFQFAIRTSYFVIRTWLLLVALQLFHPKPLLHPEA
jgi:hypothetical protein